MANLVYIDDEVYLTDIFHSLFKDTYHELHTFNDEYEAIEHCLSNPPDILFVDYRLKRMRGDEVAQRIPKDVHIILVTGDVQIDTDYKFDGVIAKPFKLVQLLHTVDGFTGH